MNKEFQYKKWANIELINAIGSVDNIKYPDQYRLSVRLLNHTYVADQIFKAHLSNLEHSYTWVNTDETPSLDDLKSSLLESDNWFIDYVSDISDVAMNEKVTFDFTDGECGSMTREEILSHLIIHGSYHRGQISMVLSECGIDKPTDIFTRFLHESEPARRG